MFANYTTMRSQYPCTSIESTWRTLNKLCFICFKIPFVLAIISMQHIEEMSSVNYICCLVPATTKRMAERFTHWCDKSLLNQREYVSIVNATMWYLLYEHIEIPAHILEKIEHCRKNTSLREDLKTQASYMFTCPHSIACKFLLYLLIAE